MITLEFCFHYNEFLLLVFACYLISNIIFWLIIQNAQVNHVIHKKIQKNEICVGSFNDQYIQKIWGIMKEHIYFKKNHTMASFDADIFLKVMEKRIAIISTCTVFFAEWYFSDDIISFSL